MGNHDRTLLVVLTALVFIRVGSFEFVNHDDPQYIFENPHVRGGLSVPSAVWAFTSLTGGISYWHPLTWLSHQLDCELFGVRPGAHHLTNLWVHLASTTVLLSILRRLRLPRRAALLVAGLFALHPLHVESVAWIAERKDVLYALGWLSALDCYLRYRETRVRHWYMLSVMTFIAALLSKPTAVTLPVVLALVECLAQDLAKSNVNRGDIPSPGRIAVRLAPFALFSGLSAIVTLVAQEHLGALRSLTQLPLSDRLDNAWLSYAWYISETLAPTRLCVSYIRSGPCAPGLVLVAFGSLSAITIGCWSRRRKQPLLLLGWLWFILTLLPNIGLVQAGPQCYANRYSYIPLIGLGLMLGQLVSTLPQAAQAWPGKWRSALVWSVLFFWGGLSFGQLDQWRNGVTLFSRAVEVDNRNWVARLGLGMALTEQRRFDEALVELEAAAALPGNRSELERCYRVFNEKVVAQSAVSAPQP